MPTQYDDLVSGATAPTTGEGAADPLATAPPTPTTPPANPYADLVGQYGAANEQRLRASVRVATETDADRHAKIVALADKNRVPPSVVADNLPLYEQRTKFNQVDFARLQAAHPELSQWLSNPDNAALAQDDLPALQILDHALRAVTDPKADPTGTLPAGFLYGRNGDIIEPDGTGNATVYSSLADVRATLERRGDTEMADQIDRQEAAKEGLARIGQIGTGVAGSVTSSLRLAGAVLPLPDGLAPTAEHVQATQDLEGAATEASPGVGGAILRGTGGIIGDLPLMFLGGPLGEAAGGAAKAAGLGIKLTKALEVGAAMQPLAIRGALTSGEDHGAGYGAANWLINTVIPGGAAGAFGVRGAVAGLLPQAERALAADGWTGAASRLFKEIGFQAGQNQVIELANALQERATGVDPNALSLNRLGPRLLVAGVLAAGQTLATHGPGSIGEKLYRDGVASEAAVSFADRFGMAADALKASKTNERAPERVAQLIDQAKGPNDKVYLQSGDWDEHWQAQGEDPLAMAQQMGAEQAYREAKATGGDMEIPVEAALRATAAEGGDGLRDKIRQAPGAMSAAEAGAHTSSLPKQIEELRQAAEQVAAQPKDTATQAVHDDLVKQLVAAGHDPSAAKRQAQIVSSVYRTMAERMNASRAEGEPRLTAQGIADRFPVTISADHGVSVDGQTVLDQRVPVADGQRLNDVEGLRARAEAEARGELKPVDPNEETGVYPAVPDDQTVLDQSANVIAAPDGRLSFHRLLKEWRKANGDRTPVTGGAEWQDLVEQSRKIDEANGKSYDQGGAEKPRAQIAFGKDRRFAITLFEGKDLSSFLHEGGHLLLEMMGDLAQDEHAPEQIKGDFAKIMDWLGVKDRSEIATEHHEQFARGFESYLMEGRAPAPGLRETFARVRQWFVDIYKTVAALGAHLNDDVRGVFDRLIATDDEISAAEQRAPAMYATAADAGMTDRQFAAYRSLVEKEHIAATAKLEHQLIAEEKAARSEQYQAAHAKTKEAVTAAVDGRPAFAALNALQDGKLPGGEAGPSVKLSREDIVAHYGEAGLKALPGPGKGKTNRGRHVYATEGGVSLDQAAELFGFANGDELYAALVAAPNRESLIEAETTAALRANGFPDSRLDGSIVEKAVDAVQSEHRADILMAELKALKKRQREAAPIAAEAAKTAKEAERQRGDAKLEKVKSDQRDAEKARRQEIADARASIPPIELLRATAKETVRGKAIEDVNPNAYLVATRKASREALAAAAKGDWREAAAAKQRELLAHELYRASMDAHEAVTKGLAYLKGMDKGTTRERIGKAGGWEWVVTRPDGTTEAHTSEQEAQDSAAKVPGATFAQTSGYLEQIDALLARFELRPISADDHARRQSLQQWIDEREANEEQVAIPDFLRDEATRKNWQHLTVDEAGGLVDAIKNIEAMARGRNKLLREQSQRDLDVVAALAKETIAKNSHGIRKQTRGRALIDKPAEWFGLMTASLRKMASIVRQMDGHADLGPIHEMLIKPLNEAADMESTRQGKAAEAFHELTKAWGKFGPSARIRRFVPELGEHLTLEQRIMVAMNWGNAGNRVRLMEGNRFNDQQVRAIIDTLDAKDMAFVQGVLDHVNSYWSDIAAKQRRVTGISPEKVDALPIETKHGTFAGGYFPIAYDSRVSPKAYGNQIEEQANLMKRGGYTASTTQRGHTKAREGDGSGAPLRLELSAIGEHLGRVIHDLSYHEALIDVNKVMRQRDVQKAILDHYGPDIYRQMQATLTDSAAGQVFSQNGFERSVNFLRTGLTTATMAWNFQTALMNVTGIFQGMHRVGAVGMAKALGRITRDALGFQSAGTWIDSVSPYMNERKKTSLRNVAEANDRLDATGALDPLRHTFHYAIQTMDRAVAIVTWLGAYEKAMAEHGVEAQAHEAADQTVRDTQGSNAVHDLAAVQRGHPLWKLFTSFYHYMSTTYNLTAESASRFRSGVEAPTSLPAIGHNVAATAKLLTDLMLLYALPAALGTVIRQTLKPPKKEEDFVVGWGKETAGMFLGTLPVVRDFAATITEGRPYGGPTGTRGLEQIGEWIGQARAETVAAIEGKARKTHAGTIRSTIQSLGVVTHMPTVQAERTIEGFLYWQEHGGSPGPLISGPPPKH